MEIKIIEKGLDYAPIQNKIDQPELKRDFEGFVRQTRLKWYFRNEPNSSFSEHLSFAPTSSWKPPKGNPSLELFSSQIEKELFKSAIPIKKLTRVGLWLFGTVRTI